MAAWVTSSLETDVGYVSCFEEDVYQRKFSQPISSLVVENEHSVTQYDEALANVAMELELFRWTFNGAWLCHAHEHSQKGADFKFGRRVRIRETKYSLDDTTWRYLTYSRLIVWVFTFSYLHFECSLRFGVYWSLWACLWLHITAYTSFLARCWSGISSGTCQCLKTSSIVPSRFSPLREVGRLQWRGVKVVRRIVSSWVCWLTCLCGLVIP